MTNGLAVGLLVVEALGLALVRGGRSGRCQPTRMLSSGRYGRRRPRAPRLRELERIEHDVVQGAANPLDLHRRLRPLLRQIAAHRLTLRHGVALDAGDGHARRLLGDEAWELLRPDRELPDERRGPRLGVHEIEAIVARLETAMTPLEDVPRTSERILDEVERAVVGKREALELVLLGILADGHVLIEDFPGLAKTLIARSFAQVASLGFSRIQFTPDLMPSDITGSSIYDQRAGDFEFRPGPDLHEPPPRGRDQPRTPEDPGRAPRGDAGAPGDDRRDDPPAREPFLVLATQNPIEYEGTYPLPEAQLDRFLLRIQVGYPDRADEWEMLERRRERRADEIELEGLVDGPTLLALQAAVEDVHVAESIGLYIVDLVSATRANPRVQVGASPRGTLALLKLSRCRAALRGRDYVTPEDVKDVAPSALAHRLTLRPEVWVQRVRQEDVVRECLEAVPTPAAEDLEPVPE